MSEQHVPLKSPGRQSVIEVPLRDSVRRDAFGAAKREASAWIAGEPLLHDLLHDPLIHAILNRDGLDLQDLLQAIALGRRRLAPPAAESDAA